MSRTMRIVMLSIILLFLLVAAAEGVNQAPLLV
jgi:hypothetical protein